MKEDRNNILLIIRARMRLISLVYIYCTSLCAVRCSLVDNIYFAINWAGPMNVKLDETPLLGNDNGAVVVTTTNNEQYRCLLPTTTENTEQDDGSISSKYVELELLKPLFDQPSCTHRHETYWIYELCHGRFLRQYHESKEMGRNPKLQEYYLGRYNMENYPSDLMLAKERQQSQEQGQKSHKVKKVQGIEIPYYEVIYSEGTPCDLTGSLRKVALHYVCQPDGRGEIYEIKETSSCEYEAIILTSLLCSHPVYGPKKEAVNTIQCHSLGESPKRPLSLDVMELENTAGRYNSKQFLKKQEHDELEAKASESPYEQKDQLIISTIWDAITQMIEKTQNVATGPAPAAVDDDDDDDDDDDEHVTRPRRPPQQRETEDDARTKPVNPISPVANKQLLKDFLDGKYCIQGGTGWWKHEFCYGKEVTQFHEDKDLSIRISLGRWSTDAHLEWASNNPRKQQRPTSGPRTTITHYYANGDFCDISGKNRFVEVRLKCAQNPAHPNSIALYLVEAKPCEYKLVVESQILCSIIEQATDDGLVLNPRL